MHWATGSALLGGPLLSGAAKVTKTFAPPPALRFAPGSFDPSPFQKLSQHPCRSTPSTAIPFTLLKRGVGAASQFAETKQRPFGLCFI